MADVATDGCVPHARAWTVALLLASAAVTVICYVLPTRGLTFLWDDWILLEKGVTIAAPGRWFQPHMHHVEPSYFAAFDAMHAIFGARTWGFILVSCAFHLLNVFLMARLLRARTGDERVAAVAAAVFGLSTVYREALWWAGAGGIVLATTLALLGFLALERARTGGDRALLVCGALAFVCPTFNGAGFFLGPVLALDAALTLPRERRIRALVAILLPWVLYGVLLRSIGGSTGARLPHDLAELRTFLVCGVYGVGLGLVKPALAIQTPDTPGSATALTLVYVVAALGVLPFLPKRQRVQVACAQLLLAGELGAVVLTKWYWWFPEAFAQSRYQYFPALAWTMLAAAALGAVHAGRRRVLLVAALVVGGMGWLQVQAAFKETRLCAPPFRVMQADFQRELVAVARSARGPLYDADLPVTFPNHASTLVRIIAPEASVVWTSSRTDASIAPYLANEMLRFLPTQKPLGEHGPVMPR
jgi:hypothetical protein